MRLTLIRKMLLGVLVVGFAMSAAGAFILYPQILKSAPKADYPPSKTAEEANLQDIDYLGRLIEVDRSFAPEARAAFIAGITELKTRAGSLSPAELEMEAARLVALADNGHTNVKGISRGVSFNALPIRIYRFAEGYFVVRARPEFAELLGAQIATINGKTPDALTEALAPFVGGPDSLRREYATYMLISPQALRAAGLAEQDDRATLTVKLVTTGVDITRELAAEPGPANGPARSDATLDGLRRAHWPKRDISPVASPVDVGEWATMLDPQGALPHYLRSPDRKYWSEEIPELDAIYVQINTVRDEEGAPTLGAFLDGVVVAVRAKQIQNAIVDLRLNPGGDYTKSAGFTKDLPEALPSDGRLFILTSGNTFSAAIVTAARLKYFGGERAMIVGEPMGDREQFWGEGRNILLPNSGLQVGYATAAHDWERGCALSQIRTCFYVNYVLGVPAGKLTPDLAIAPTFADYSRGEDTILNAVAAELAGID